MAHTDHHAPYRLREIPAQRAARNTHSLGVSLANRAAGPHRYRDENGTGEKVTSQRGPRTRVAVLKPPGAGIPSAPAAFPRIPKGSAWIPASTVHSALRSTWL
jgi:hypothetical protein